MARLTDSLIAQIIKNLSGSKPDAKCSTTVATLGSLACEVRDRRAADPVPPSQGTRLVWRREGDDAYEAEINGYALCVVGPFQDGKWLVRGILEDDRCVSGDDGLAARLYAEEKYRAYFRDGLAALNGNAPDATAQEGARDK